MNIHRFKRLVMGAALLAGIVGSSAVFTAAGGDDNSNSNSNSNNDGERFSVALWGDMPYVKGGAEWTSARQVENLIADVNKQKVAFSVFDGDIKSGSSFCDNSQYTQAIARFNTFKAPAVYVPGDNEWTDCHRALGAARDPLERLQKLRSLFFADDYSLGQRKITLARQSAAYPENARWEHQGIVFATLNVPGSSNNARMPDELAARGKANDAWITNTYAHARAQSRHAVVLVMQADPFAGDGRVSRHYTDLMNAITRETMNFNGEVLLIHGDTHRYRFDQPLMDPRTQQALRNFTRLEVFGYPLVNWVRVRVGQRDGKVTFLASPGG